MRFVIVTGMSGAGKSTALKTLEDAGYFCVDNLPVPLVGKFTELAAGTAKEYNGVVLGLDVRSLYQMETGHGAEKGMHHSQSGEAAAEDGKKHGHPEPWKVLKQSHAAEELLKTLKNSGCPYEILFLEAENATLVKRYKETRRSHPLSRGGRIDVGICREREVLGLLKEQADYIVDTSHMLARELRQELGKIFVSQQPYKNMFVTVLSFGFKYGIPADADLVFDVRFLPNPYYVDGLREKTGNDADVQQYVMDSETAQQFVKKWTELIDFLIPHYIAEGKTQLVIGVGCTGGKHRSVTLANRLYEHLQQKEYGIKIEHRDILR